MIFEPRFECDQAVRVIRNLRNDGTYPGEATGTLLVRRGSIGYVRHIGVFLQDQLIYSVHFIDDDNRIIGCRETELIPADAPWIPNLFERGDRVNAKLSLVSNGEVVVASGALGEVMAVDREQPEAIHYNVLFGQRLFQVPESALTAIQSPAE